jgi:hypothetical protein
VNRQPSRVTPPGQSGLGTVGQLRAALHEYPDDTPVELAVAGADLRVGLVSSYWSQRPGDNTSRLRTSLAASLSDLQALHVLGPDTAGYLRGLQTAVTELTNWASNQPSGDLTTDCPVDQHTLLVAIGYLRAVHQSASQRLRAQQEEGT